MLCKANTIEIEDMSQDQRQFLIGLNSKLLEFEKQLVKESELLVEQAEK